MEQLFTLLKINVIPCETKKIFLRTLCTIKTFDCKRLEKEK